MILGDFQIDVIKRVSGAWDEGARNVMLCIPTGGGKTVIFTHMVETLDKPTCAIAHRQELVSQIALAFNRARVMHGIIAPAAVIQQIVRLEMETHGYSVYRTSAQIRVAGIDTLARWTSPDEWCKRVEYVVQDEGHHILKSNKWGTTQQRLFPQARGLYATAHAVRGDGKGLGRDADGLVDALVVGPCGRDLIWRGFLTDYGLRCPPSDIDLSGVNVGASGEYEGKGLRAAHHKSKTLVGDVVGDYIQHAGGKLWFTFAVDVEQAQEIAAAYCKRNVHAQVITANTPIAVRSQLMRRFRARDILQLVSVDTLGEGVDVPAVEGVSMARGTASWQTFSQQAGRMMRVNVGDHMAHWHGYTDAHRLELIAASAKPRGQLFDYVGNVARHYEYRKFPCSRQQYSLDKAERKARGKTDAIPLTTCLACFFPYERHLAGCPLCGNPRPLPAARTIEVVEGSLGEVSAEWLASKHAEIARIDGSAPPAGRDVVSRSIAKQHEERYKTQQALRESIAYWAGYYHDRGRTDAEIHRLFYHTFEIDVASAQALGYADAARLQARVVDHMFKGRM